MERASASSGDRWAHDLKGSRWALLKNPEDLTEAQAAQLRRIRRSRGRHLRAYETKEQFRAVLGGGLKPRRRGRAHRPVVRQGQPVAHGGLRQVAKTMRQRRHMILNAI